MTKTARLVLVLVAAACGCSEEVPPDGIYPYVIGGSGEERVSAMAPGADGDIVIAGTFSGTLDFGLESVTAAGDRDIYVVVMDSLGGPRWIWTATDGANVEADIDAVAVDDEGAVYALVLLAGGADLGGGHVVASRAIVKLDAAGQVVATHDFATVSDVVGIALGADGGVNVATNQALGTTLVSLTSELEVDWERTLTATGTDAVSLTLDLATTPAGDVVAYGAFTDTLDLGDGTDPLVVPAGQARFVARFTGPVTAQAAMLTEADTSIFGERTLAVDPAGGVHLGGDFWTVLDAELRPARETPLDATTFVGELHVLADGDAVWRGDQAILRLSVDGEETDRVEVGGADARFRGAVVTPLFEVVAVGDFAGEAVIDGRQLDASQDRDVFVTLLPAPLPD